MFLGFSSHQQFNFAVLQRRRYIFIANINTLRLFTYNILYTYLM